MAEWHRILSKYISKPKRLKNIAQITGISVLIGGSALAVSDTQRFEENIVSNVYGGLRFIRTFQTGIWISIDYYVSMLGLHERSANYNAMMSRIHQRSADRILNGCLQNGGTYVKLGQGLVSLSHILPKEYIQTLKALQDKCLAREKNEIYQIFEEDFGKKPEDMFSSFEMVPLAAASIAHVYKAQTKDNQTVAVKVQYKDLQKRFNSDILTIKILISFGSLLHPTFDFSWVLDDLQDALKQELDFVNEAHNAERCAKDLRQFNYVHIPKVHWDLTSTRVLVTEFIDGIKINDVESLKNNGYSLADIDRKLFEAFGHQVFQTGFVHADPHPGNVLVRRNASGNAQLVILDHGLYQEVSEKDRIALSHFWKAIVLRDHVNMKKFSNMLGVENHEVFAEILTQSPLRLHGFRVQVHLSEADLNYMQEAARRKFDKIMTCLQTMPRTLLLVIRNLNTLRAIAYEHGNPIDRYAVLARMATKASFADKASSQRIWIFIVRFYFEFLLNVNKIINWLKSALLDIMYHTGLAPNVKSLMTDMTNALNAV